MPNTYPSILKDPLGFDRARKDINRLTGDLITKHELELEEQAKIAAKRVKKTKKQRTASRDKLKPPPKLTRKETAEKLEVFLKNKRANQG